MCGCPKEDSFGWEEGVNFLFGGGVFGDSLGSLGHGVFGEFTGQKKPDGGLDLARCDGAPLVVVGETAGFG